MPVGSIVKQPAALSFVEGASIWMMFVTAYSALVEDAKVSKGDFVIIPAASSSVGLAAIQIINYAGATSIALTRTSTKRKQLLEAGAAHAIGEAAARVCTASAPDRGSQVRTRLPAGGRWIRTIGPCVPVAREPVYMSQARIWPGWCRLGSRVVSRTRTSNDLAHRASPALGSPR
jgi:hypothetical protein